MSNFVKLTVDVLSVGDLVSLVSDASTGAIAIFVGTTRDNFNGKKVLRLVSELSFCLLLLLESFLLTRNILTLLDLIFESRWSMHHDIETHWDQGAVEIPIPIFFEIW